MLFPTVQFAVFFVVVFTLNWLLRPQYTLWRITMVAASFLFYGWWNWRFTFLLGASVVVNWLFGHATAAALGPGGERTTASRWVVRVAVVLNLAALAWWKYAEWFVVDVWNPTPLPPISVTLVENIVLPVGISFFTFQALSYVIDVGRGQQRPMSVLDFAFYLSFFAQLVAGPIVRATEFAPQIRTRPDPRRINSAPAFRLIAAGLFKKVVVSTYVAAEIVDPVFAAPSQHSAPEVLWAILGYAIQIYADFSGYTDIAIGCALLVGFRFPQNFDAPYTARSAQDFWRRWHMTLSRWLRDYLYIPLGGNRLGERRTYLNLMLTMVLGGLWHGAAWQFVVWGAIHGGYLGAERWIKERWQPRGFPLAVVAAGQWLLTFVIVCVAWVFFRAPDVSFALDTLGQLLTGWGPPPHPGPSLVHPMVVFVIVGMIAIQFVPERLVMRAQEEYSRLGLAWQAAALGVALLFIDTLGPQGVAPFIYFQF
jgi:D-alanyl-lipoteichoic acid acyltransferase DltB (MBOAT superfamily)